MNLAQSLPLRLGASLRDGLEDILGGYLPPEAAALATDVVSWLVVAVLILTIVQVVMLWSTWLERKFIGRIQDRIGPNRVGAFGLAQPLADMVKILTKEDITPSEAHRWVYNLGAILIVPPTILLFAVIPLSAELVASDLSVGLLFFLAVASTSVVPIFMAGWGSRNKYALLGAMRAVAQIVSYEIPQVLSVVGVIALAGTLSLQGIVVAQGPLPAEVAAFPGVWLVLLQPIGFVIFTLATAAEIERTPFDIPEAESEIIAGYHTEYSGLKFGMFYLALYFATIAAGALGTVLFLGGWQPPLAALGFIPGWIWFSVKTVGMILIFMWLRATLPRLRVDQLMAFAWKLLVPLTLANLLLTALVSKLTYDARAGAAPGSLAASPLFVVLAFWLANAALLLLGAGLAMWWQRRDEQTELRFDEPHLAEARP
jgi:NADH-quinone oxidoreductase subunit H